MAEWQMSTGKTNGEIALLIYILSLLVSMLLSCLDHFMKATAHRFSSAAFFFFSNSGV